MTTKRPAAGDASHQASPIQSRSDLVTSYVMLLPVVPDASGSQSHGRGPENHRALGLRRLWCCGTCGAHVNPKDLCLEGQQFGRNNEVIHVMGIGWTYLWRCIREWTLYMEYQSQQNRGTCKRGEKDTRNIKKRSYYSYYFRGVASSRAFSFDDSGGCVHFD